MRFDNLKIESNNSDWTGQWTRDEVVKEWTELGMSDEHCDGAWNWALDHTFESDDVPDSDVLFDMIEDGIIFSVSLKLKNGWVKIRQW